MKILIMILTLVSFIQTTIFPIDLVLIILICRGYIKDDPKNLYLAFVFGLLVSMLDLKLLGLQSIIYLILIQATQVFSRLRLAGSWLLIFPINLILLYLSLFINSIFLHQSAQYFPKIFIGSFLSLPIFFLIKLWEERFIVHKGIKLRI